ncbi:FMN-binding protein [Amycolatopsis sp. NEAU-NG30]|uniref:FMN-binding protein n=1 Tax=Amycolatopsis melonis TaxID=3156488 RepID=A0ABV0L8B9_9PSEU
MKKTIFVVALSIAGFIAVWRFEPGPVHNTAAVAQAPSSTSAPSTSATSTAPSTSASPDATVTTQGTAESGRYGTVQVQVTFTGSRISVITLLQAPDDGRALTALPRLQEEAMQAQSADIDTVTGATETSESYKTSLQAAIDAKGNR